MNSRDVDETQNRLDAETLFRRHASWVARYVVRLGFRGQDVDDVVQETFLVAHKRGGFEPGQARPTTWLAEIAWRVAQASRRSRERHPIAEESATDAVPAADDPLQDAMRSQALRNVQRALESLDLERRALFILYELEGESCEVLATTFGVPVGTVYSRLHHARKTFMQAYGKLSQETVGQP